MWYERYYPRNNSRNCAEGSSFVRWNQTPDTQPKEFIPHVLSPSVLLLIIMLWWRQIQMELWDLCSAWFHIMSLLLTVTEVWGSFCEKKVLQKCSWVRQTALSQMSDVGWGDYIDHITCSCICLLQEDPQKAHTQTAAKTMSAIIEIIVRMQNRDTFMSAGNGTKVNRSCCYPKPKEELGPTRVDIIMEKWGWSCVCLLITIGCTSKPSPPKEVLHCCLWHNTWINAAVCLVPLVFH